MKAFFFVNTHFQKIKITGNCREKMIIVKLKRMSDNSGAHRESVRHYHAKPIEGKGYNHINTAGR
jgi:hypothetical protein